jgi:hypothetical protein
MVVSVI